MPHELEEDVGVDGAHDHHRRDDAGQRPCSHDVFAIALRRLGVPFFRVNPSDVLARFTVASLTTTPNTSTRAATSSGAVLSGMSSMVSSSHSRCSAISFRFSGDHRDWGLAANLPSRSRRSQRLTLASPTPKRSASSAYVPSPSLYAFTTRSRSSTGRALGTSTSSLPITRSAHSINSLARRDNPERGGPQDAPRIQDAAHNTRTLR